MLSPIRITPLSILKTYKKVLSTREIQNFQKIKISKYSLCLNENNAPHSLWKQLLNYIQCKDAATCILTPDTEEAFVRISAIPKTSNLCRLSFTISIESHKEAFAGYWMKILEIIANENYNVFSGHNLMIEKTQDPHIEKAEFSFLLDKGDASDIGSFSEIKVSWENRLNKILKEFSLERGDQVSISKLVFNRPRGVGIPCFFSCNAKSNNGIGSKVAAEICRRLEGEGFRPVNIDVSNGKDVLRTQVQTLMKACYLMIILNCPEDKLKRVDGQYGISDWVAFEEGLMAAQGGTIMRFRFANVAQPWHTVGHPPEFIINENPNDIEIEEMCNQLSIRLKRWMLNWRNSDQDEHFNIQNLPDEDFGRDLVAHYGGR